MEVIHRDGVFRPEREGGRPSRDGIVDMLMDDWENRAGLRTPFTSFYARATLYRSLDAAQAGFASECDRIAARLPWKEISDGTRGDYCVSDTVRGRNDPEGGCLAMDSYGSFITVRRGRILLAINAYAETRDDSGAATREYLAKFTEHMALASVTPQ